MTGNKQVDDLLAYQKLTAVWVYLLVTNASEEAKDLVEDQERKAVLDIPYQAIEHIHEDARNRYIGKGLK